MPSCFSSPLNFSISTPESFFIILSGQFLATITFSIPPSFIFFSISLLPITICSSFFAIQSFLLFAGLHLFHINCQFNHTRANRRYLPYEHIFYYTAQMISFAVERRVYQVPLRFLEICPCKHAAFLSRYAIPSDGFDIAVYGHHVSQQHQMPYINIKPLLIERVFCFI